MTLHAARCVGACTSARRPVSHAQVPTEFLDEQLSIPIRIPRELAHSSAAARLIHAQPRFVIGSICCLSLLAAVWVGLDAGDKFSVDPILFSPMGDLALDDYFRLSDIDDLETCKAANCQIDAHDAAAARGSFSDSQRRLGGTVRHTKRYASRGRPSSPGEAPMFLNS